jgi:cell division protein FtsB
VADKKGDRQRGRRGARTARRGRRRADDRPYLVALFGLLVVIGAMAVGPLRSLAAANDRVDELTEQRDALAESVEVLESESEALRDPAEMEAYAREELGLVRPGDIPYVVVPDEEPEPGSSPTPGPGEDAAGARNSPWYERLADALTSVFGTAGGVPGR